MNDNKSVVKKLKLWVLAVIYSVDAGRYLGLCCKEKAERILILGKERLALVI